MAKPCMHGNNHLECVQCNIAFHQFFVNVYRLNLMNELKVLKEWLQEEKDGNTVRPRKGAA